METKYNNQIKIFAFDFNEDEKLTLNLESISKSYKKIDILVNNAGEVTNELYLMMTEKKLREIYEIKFFCTIKNNETCN